MVRKILLFVIFILGLTLPGFSQVKRDSLSLLHSPTKATILSAALPGAGQAYNKKYWKIPIIYAGFVGLGYFIQTNNKDYKVYKEAYSLRLDGNESTVDNYVGIYSDQDLSTLKNYYRRNRDLSIIGVCVLYVLNVVDASVDANLFYFNVNDDLSLNIQPGINVGTFAGPALSISMHF